MLKKLLLVMLLTGLCSCKLFAAPQKTEKDSLVTILQMNQYNLQERLLIFYLKPYYEDAPINELLARKIKTDSLLDRYNTENKQSYKNFVMSICQERLNYLDDAESDISAAIAHLDKPQDHFLRFVFFEYWGNIRAEKGNGIAAIYSYWVAKGEATILHDYYSQAVLDIDISDLYYKGSAYNQALFYLNQAHSLISRHKLDESLSTLVYYNKVETFFRMNNADSLAVYDQKLKSSANVTYKIQTYRLRADYYLLLLQHNYKGAIQLIRSMMGGNKLYLYSELDKQHLADAYFMNGQTDSAQLVINELLQAPLESDNPEIKLHLYQELTTIARINKNEAMTVRYTALALQESQKYINRLTQVNNMSSQMQMDEMQTAYVQSAENDKVRSVILSLGLIIAILALIAIYLVYRSIKQKRLYENFLYREEKNELAFINSHRVRKYMSNVLGLISVIRQSDEPKETFLESQDYLYKSAQQLDDAIKSISKKLDS